MQNQFLKQNKMKVIQKVRQTMYCNFCPSCGENVTKLDSPYVCRYCGQMLDWKEAKGNEPKEI